MASSTVAKVTVWRTTLFVLDCLLHSLISHFPFLFLGELMANQFSYKLSMTHLILKNSCLILLSLFFYPPKNPILLSYFWCRSWYLTLLVLLVFTKNFQLFYDLFDMGSLGKSASSLSAPFPNYLAVCWTTQMPEHILELHSRPPPTVRTKHLCHFFLLSCPELLSFCYDIYNCLICLPLWSMETSRNQTRVPNMDGEKQERDWL